jgi:DNA-binding NarL/FixJ family response regulator
MERQQDARKRMGRHVRVLIVDPHASFRSAIKALLQTEGFAVVADLEHCEGATDAATRLLPDVVLIDVSLHQREGLDLARHLSALPKRPAIVLISASSSEAILAALAGADLFLAKADITAQAVAQVATRPRP